MILISSEAGTTSGRTVSECGQMAVTTMHSTSGTTMGPPADSEYAVEPVGVAKITPSAVKLPISSAESPRPTRRRHSGGTRCVDHVVVQRHVRGAHHPFGSTNLGLEREAPVQDVVARQQAVETLFHIGLGGARQESQASQIDAEHR